MARNYFVHALLLVLIAPTSGARTSGDEVVMITGATGRTGALVYNLLKKDGYTVRGIVRSVDKAKEVLDCSSCDTSDGIYVGDVTDETTLTTPMEGVTRLIILSGSVPLKADNGTYYFPPGGHPKDVDFNGVKKQVIAAKKAGVKHVLLVSSMGTTTPNSFLDRLGNGQALFYKLNGEATLMSAGLPFTIVKPAGLLGEELPAGTRRLVIGHEDHLMDGVTSMAIPRADVADVLKEAIKQPTEVTQNIRFDLSSDPTRPATGDFRKLFEDAGNLSADDDDGSKISLA